MYLNISIMCIRSHAIEFYKIKILSAGLTALQPTVKHTSHRRMAPIFLTMQVIAI